jgi:hypothetical protein
MARRRSERRRTVSGRLIFEMYASGNSQAAIAKALNAKSVPSPNPPKTRQVRA